MCVCVCVCVCVCGAHACVVMTVAACVCRGPCVCVGARAEFVCIHISECASISVFGQTCTGSSRGERTTSREDQGREAREQEGESKGRQGGY